MGDEISLEPVLHALLRSSLTTVDDRTLDAALDLMVKMLVTVVPQTLATSVTMRRGPDFRSAASTGSPADELDVAQFRVDEGPCLEAATTGELVLTDDGVCRRRWPAYAPSAAEHGVHGSISVPITASQRPIGALNVYLGSPAGDLGDPWRALILEAGRYSSVLADNSSTHLDVDEFVEDLRKALNRRTEVGQAQGVLMAREAVDREHAYRLLIDRSRREGRTLVEVARAVIAECELTGEPDAPPAT